MGGFNFPDFGDAVAGDIDYDDVRVEYSTVVIKDSFVMLLVRVRIRLKFRALRKIQSSRRDGFDHGIMDRFLIVPVQSTDRTGNIWI